METDIQSFFLYIAIKCHWTFRACIVILNMGLIKNENNPTLTAVLFLEMINAN